MPRGVDREKQQAAAVAADSLIHEIEGRRQEEILGDLNVVANGGPEPKSAIWLHVVRDKLKIRKSPPGFLRISLMISKTIYPGMRKPRN